MKKSSRKRRGQAIIWVLLVGVFSMVLLSIMLAYTRQNILEAKLEEERIRAHYIALSGAELVYSALNERDGKSKLYMDKAMDEPYKLRDVEIPIEDKGLEIGSANIRIHMVTIDDNQWLKIESTGRLSDSPVKVVSSIRVYKNNHNRIIRENK